MTEDSILLNKGYRYITVDGHEKRVDVYIVELSIGRPLKAHENVHHRNGIHSDNRLKNLELWDTPIPEGIRLSDALDHAEEVLRMYSPELLKPN